MKAETCQENAWEEVAFEGMMRWGKRSIRCLVGRDRTCEVRWIELVAIADPQFLRKFYAFHIRAAGGRGPQVCSNLTISPWRSTCFYFAPAKFLQTHRSLHCLCHYCTSP